MRARFVVLALCWGLSASAAELEVVGFSGDGRLATVRVVQVVAGDVRVQVQTLDVARGTWNHFPADGNGVDVAAATRAATASVPFGYMVLPSGAVAGRPLRMWMAGSRAHEHRAPHVVTWRVTIASGTGEAVLSERPGSACVGGVEPWLIWRAPDGRERELLADRVPRRWPLCSLAFDLVEVEEGPRGVLLFVIRTLSMHGEVAETGWLVASWRPGAVPANIPRP